jgi:hypothetical protein
MRIYLYRIFDEYVVFNCRRNKRCLLLFAALFILGLILGLFLGSGGIYTEEFFSNSISFTIEIIAGRVSFGGVFFRGLLINLQYFALFFIFSFSVYLLPLHYLFITYKGYVFGAAIVVFTRALGIGGFSAVFLLVLPQQLILLFFLCLFSAHITPALCRLKTPFSDFWGLCKLCLIFYLFSLFNIIVELLLIYAIIKPFNIIV